MPYDPYVLGSNRKIDPTRRPSSLTEFLPDGTPNDGDRVEIGPTDLAFAEWAALGLTIPDMPSLRDYRLSRLVEQVNKHDLGGLLMFDPLNIRYATDTTNMQIWVMHNFCRACLVLPDGHMALWDYTPARHLSAHLPLVKEVHPGADFFYMDAAQRAEERAALFAQQVDSIVRAHAGDNRRLGLDKSEIATYWALENIGFKIRIGQEMTEHARKVKNENELNAMRCAIAACEAAMAEMQAAVIPGMTEVGAWAELQKGNHIRGGEWI
ncbi:MAG TPA: peptidase M24, partial [Rhodospirillaceae bacterium]|nr:peptidase M24 [Rhodospirillaceae bacterium]